MILSGTPRKVNSLVSQRQRLCDRLDLLDSVGTLVVDDMVRSETLDVLEARWTSSGNHSALGEELDQLDKHGADVARSSRDEDGRGTR